MPHHEVLTLIALIWTGFCFTVIIALLVVGLREFRAIQLLQAAIFQKLLNDHHGR